MAREETDSVRAAAAVTDARAKAELQERQRAHGDLVFGLNQQLQQLRYARRCSILLTSAFWDAAALTLCVDS